MQACAIQIHYHHLSLWLQTGQVSTYQMGAQQQWGVAYKITPETTEVELNVMKCFQVNGTKNETVTPQASLPDVQSFQVCVIKT